MKNIIISLFIVMVLLNVIGCDEKECVCDPKAHLGIGENCSCGGSGCGCAEQTAVVADTTIPIRKQAGVSVAQMNKAVETINEEYNKWTTTQKQNFIQKVTTIHITPGNIVSFSNSVLVVGCEAEGWNIFDCVFENNLFS